MNPLVKEINEEADKSFIKEHTAWIKKILLAGGHADDQALKDILFWFREGITHGFGHGIEAAVDHYESLDKPACQGCSNVNPEEFFKPLNENVEKVDEGTLPINLQYRKGDKGNEDKS